MNWIKSTLRQIFLSLVCLIAMAAMWCLMLGLVVWVSFYLKDLAVNHDPDFYLFTIMPMLFVFRNVFFWFQCKLEMFFEKRGLE